jgi:hypothetical protein
MHHRRLAVVVVALLSWAQAAQADPVTFYFEGVVEFAQGPRIGELLAPGVTGADLIGTQISGWYTFDSEAVDTLPEFFQAGYRSSGAPFGYVMQFAHRTFTFDSVSIGVLVDFDNMQVMPGIKDDTYTVAQAGPHPTDPALELRAFLDLLAFGTATEGPTTSLLDTSLPLVPPDLAGFSVRRVFMNVLENGNVVAGLGGSLTTLKLVPEPATALLLAPATLLLLARCRRRRAPPVPPR